ncbi:MAG: hypothetical protein RTU63_05865 [Candidatus Thorarchaeota archaeon]
MQLDYITSLLLIFGLIMIVGIVIQAIFLGVGLGFVNGENRELGTTFVTALLMGLVGLIPCVGCFISWYLIKTRHNTSWGGALVAWLLGGIIMIVVIFVIILTFFSGIFALLGLGGYLPMP